MTQKTEIKGDPKSSTLLYGAFGLCFRFLSQVYLEIPSGKFIDEIKKNRLFFKWPVAENQKSISKGLKILQNFCEEYQPKNIKSLQQDYTRLFIGLEKILAPPYASVYLSEDFLLYDLPFFDVRRFYKKIGLSVNPKIREPDDHIGFELYCLAYLSEKAVQAAEKNDIKKFVEYQTKLREFLSDFLSSWLDSFLSQVKDNAQTSFYVGVALLTSGLMESLSRCLDGGDIIMKS